MSDKHSLDKSIIQDVLNQVDEAGKAIRTRVLEMPLEFRFFAGSLLASALLTEYYATNRFLTSLLSQGQAIKLTKEQVEEVEKMFKEIKSWNPGKRSSN